MTTQNIEYSFNENVLHRVRNSQNLIQLNTTCSYCNALGHNITNCNSLNLILFNELCFIIKNEIVNRELFTRWLITFALANISRNCLVKAYGVSKCGCRFSDNMCVVIENIANKIYNLTDSIQDLVLSDMPSDLLIRALSDIPSGLATINAQVYPEEPPSIELIYDTTLNEHVDTIKECPICYEEKGIQEIIQLNCKHELCKVCTKKICETNSRCPCCRAKIENITYNVECLYEYFVKE